jgi:glycosyltransferase involved in cell wall biosynthesis
VQPLTIFVPHPSNFLTDHRPSGDGLLAWSFLERLAGRGHRLHVACQRVDVLAPERENLRLYPLSDAPKLLVRERLRYMRRMRRLYDSIRRRERIDLVHQLNPVDLGVSLALPRSAPPLVLGPYVPDWPAQSGRLHPLPPPPPRLRARAAVELRDRARALQQRRAALLLLSTPAAEAKLPRRLPSTRIEVLPPGIEAGRFVAEEPVARGDAPTILFLANVQIRKGVLTLVEAFEQVVVDVPDARLIIAGGGPDEPAVRERVAGSPARERIELVGNVARERIADMLAAADVFCAPSYGEPFGLSPLEAMAAGLPVVSTNSGGLAHLVPPGGGVQVPPRDATALGEALAALLRDPARRAAMGRVNRETVARRYEWSSVIDRLEELYAETVGGRGVDAYAERG